VINAGTGSGVGNLRGWSVGVDCSSRRGRFYVSEYWDREGGKARVKGINQNQKTQSARNLEY
jgi:hypothetical protein